MFQIQELPQIILVDETEIQVGGRTAWVWFATNPYNGKILHIKVSYSRTSLVALIFFQEMIRIYGRRPRIAITDGGVWYPYALQRLGIQHEVFSGGIRSYVESIIGCIKQRTNHFYNYFPCGCRFAKHVENWLNLVVFEHNVAFISEGRGCFLEFTQRLMEVLSC